MAKEIERKFLVRGPGWKDSGVRGRLYRQGYLPTAKGTTARVRVVQGKKKAYLTIKGPRHGITRSEFEYKIPAEDAEQMLSELCYASVTKTRYKVPHQGFVWEVDVFHGDNEDLVTVEVELCSEDQEFDVPAWVGEEVTDDSRYSSAALARLPYQQWRSRQ